MDASTDDTSSSNASTPVATSPSVEAGAGAGAGQTPRAASSGNPEGLLPPRRKRNRPAKSCFQCRQRKIRCDRKYPCGSCIRAKFDNCTYRQPETRSWPPGGVLSPAPTAAPHPHHQVQQPLPAPAAIGHHGTQYHPPPPPYPPPQQSQQYLVPPTTFGSSYRGDRDVNSHDAYAGSSAAGAASLPTSSAYPSPHRNSNNTNWNGTTRDTVSGLESTIQQLQEQLAQQGTIIQQLQQGKGRDFASNDRSAGGNVSSQVGEVLPAGRGVMSKSRYFGQSHWMNGLRFVSSPLY